MIPSIKTADELLNNGIDLFNKGEWDRASECWENAKEIYLELRDKQGISNTLGNLGLVYQNKGEWEHAIEFYEKSLKISEELGDKHGISNALNNLGTIYQNKGEWEHAIEFYEKSLKISEELGDKQGISNAFNNLGLVFQDKGEWEHAIEFYEKCLKISEELGDKKGIAYTLNNLGNVHQNKGKWEHAIEFYEKCLKISEELGDKQGIACTLGNIGELQIINGNWDEAKKNLERSFAIAEKLAPIATVEAQINIGELFRLEDQYNDAFRKLQDALQIAGRVGSKTQEILILEKLGDTHIDKYTADKNNENLSSAEKFYDLSRRLAKSLNSPLQEATAIRGIGVVQAKKRDMVASKRSFRSSIEILRRLGACFELQKTLLEYARILYQTNVLVEAEMVAKASAFDALRNDYRELLMKLYLLLGDIEMRKEEQYEYYLEALRASEFNPKIYVRTCFILIFRMRTMERQTLLKFIESLKEVNRGKDIYFNQFLEALNAKIEGKTCDISDLPSSLEQEIKKF
ncbi:MAG TPA: tetratricopeptide repeat protein [Candidatus Methanoperedens sp.]